MKNRKIIFRCQECGYSSPKWLGKCPDCNKWNTLVEEKEELKHPKRFTTISSQLYKLDEIPSEPFDRTSTGIDEFDRIVGGGIVKGSLILVGGPPGIGKSTILLQVAGNLLDGKEVNVLYVSGEESIGQVKMRADRLGLKSKSMYILSETNLENILERAKEVHPQFLFIDSIQTMYRNDVQSAPGSVSQVRECAAEILLFAKSNNIATFITGHVTKEGAIAGPRVLEHIVDTVLYFDSEKNYTYRFLRSYKNRFGPANEIGIFDMRETGLYPVKNPSEIFLTDTTNKASGSVVVSIIEGSRPILLELQALVSTTNFGIPRRQVYGFDYNRAIIIISVLEKRLGFHLGGQDIFVNVVGGIKIKEPSADLGLCCAIVSCFENFIIEPKTVIIGEIGLMGEVRSVNFISERIDEAEKEGFANCIIPKSNLKNLRKKFALNLLGVSGIKDAIEFLKK